MRSEELEMAAEWVERRLEGGNEEIWCYVGVTFLSRKPEKDLLLELRPEVSLRVLEKSSNYAESGRFVAEGHGEFRDIPEVLKQIDRVAMISLEVRSVSVEPHDYELIEASSFYVEA